MVTAAGASFSSHPSTVEEGILPAIAGAISSITFKSIVQVAVLFASSVAVIVTVVNPSLITVPANGL